MSLSEILQLKDLPVDEPKKTDGDAECPQYKVRAYKRQNLLETEQSLRPILICTRYRCAPRCVVV